MTAEFTVAEEIIDRQSRTETMRGQQIEVATGRIKLHAVAVNGQDAAARTSDARAAVCGRLTDLTWISKPWVPGYLPHLARCAACSAATGYADTSAGRLADGVDVRTARDSERERTGADALRSVLAEHDLRRWMLTDLVLVDDSIRGGFSHPLTINPALLLSRPASALTTFLHEQLHWLTEPGIRAAIREAGLRWPEPPPPPAGCQDSESSWLHVVICALEYESLSELIGVTAATAELRQQVHYSWVYGLILDDPGWFSEFLRRHELQVPQEPTVPRRYVGEDWWTSVV